MDPRTWSNLEFNIVLWCIGLAWVIFLATYILISWIEVLRRRPFWELVREIVIVSGNDGSRCFSGMTVLNWKPADESLEQARNK